MPGTPTLFFAFGGRGLSCELGHVPVSEPPLYSAGPSDQSRPLLQSRGFWPFWDAVEQPGRVPIWTSPDGSADGRLTDVRSLELRPCPGANKKEQAGHTRSSKGECQVEHECNGGSKVTFGGSNRQVPYRQAAVRGCHHTPPG